MGKSDTVMNIYLSQKDRCADFIQNLVFNNRVHITEDMIQINNSRQAFVDKKKNGRLMITEKYRDILAYVNSGFFCMIAGIESQKNLSNIMPVRAMIYDGISYEDQIKELQAKYKKERESKYSVSSQRDNIAFKNHLKQLKKDDFLSGICADDKLTPVITIVFFYGEERWDRSMELYDMLDFGNIYDDLKPFVQNYKINLVDIHDIEDTSVFTTDLGIMIELMKIRKDRNLLENYINSHSDFLKKTSGDVYDMIAELINSQWLINKKKKYINKKRGVFDMCTGMREWLDEVESLGFAKGETSGFAKGETSGFAKGETSGFAKGETSGFTKGIKSGINISLDIIKEIQNGQQPEIIAAKYDVDINQVLVIMHSIEK